MLQAVMQTMKQAQPTCHKQEDLTEGKLRPEGTTASQGFCWQSTCSTCGTIVTTEKMAHGDCADMSSVQGLSGHFTMWWVATSGSPHLAQNVPSGGLSPGPPCSAAPLWLCSFEFVCTLRLGALPRTALAW